MESNKLNRKMEDHALEPVPDSERQNWLSLSWNTAGIVTTLIQLFLGALVAFVAGLKIAVIAGVFVVIVGFLMGWGVGHIGYRKGCSSTLISRTYGLGNKGSILASAIFGFMIIGFLAIENALLYKGFLFFFEIQDTLSSQIIIYGLMTAAWILLTAFGFQLVVKVSSVTLIAFLLVLLWMVVDIISQSEQSFLQAMTFGTQLPAEAIAAMGLHDDTDKFIFCVNVLIGSAGALALVDGDFGRYARRSRDIGIAALAGNISMSIVMLTIGGMVMFAGMASIVDYFVSVRGMEVAAAQQLALQSPDSIASAFIIFGGVIGAVLMVLAQSKAQVLNTYSGSLALTNLFDVAFDWRPGRIVFVVLANVIGLVMLYGKILVLVNAWITILGVMTTALAMVMISDYFIVRPILGQSDISEHQEDTVNWSGVISLIAATILAHYVLNKVQPVEFFTSAITVLILYPMLRLITKR
ncbi:MAG: cytosine permease [Proteobacteria bacterium]|nr:cytosine permease [Pseudomonadota bacterium]